ncbi:MAG: hypothetical protein HY867_13665 [Chloroflexi bacterium]|nr:hypothetical protein [Chloroflexota bacterium]
MELFLTFIGIAAIGVGVVLLLRPTPDTSDSEPSTAVQTRQADHTQLVPTDATSFRRDLQSKGTIGRAWETKKTVSTAQYTEKVIRAETGVLEAQGHQIKTVLENQNDIQRLQNQSTLLPFEQLKELTDLLATITENQLRVAEAESKIRDTNKPSPEVSTSLREPDDPIKQLKDRWRAALARSVVGRQEVFEDLEREAKEQFKDKPQFLQIYLDKLTQLFEEDPHT